MTRGRCGWLILHRKGLSPSTPRRSPGARDIVRIQISIVSPEIAVLCPPKSQEREHRADDRVGIAEHHHSGDGNGGRHQACAQHRQDKDQQEPRHTVAVEARRTQRR